MEAGLLLVLVCKVLVAASGVGDGLAGIAPFAALLGGLSVCAFCLAAFLAS